MSLGEIPGGNLRGYWKLENANDSSGNGFNLTSSGTVNYVQARFNNGADFGSSGTTNGLYYGSNPFASDTPDEVYFSFWFKLNSTSATARNHFLFFANSKTSATNGRAYGCFYTISGGNITVTARRRISGLNIDISVTQTVDSDWHFVTIRYSATSNNFVLVLHNDDMSFTEASSGNTSTGQSLTTDPTVFFTIGNARALNVSAYAIIDEFFISESLYTQSVAIDGGADQSHRIRYRAHALGRFV